MFTPPGRFEITKAVSYYYFFLPFDFFQLFKVFFARSSILHHLVWQKIFQVHTSSIIRMPAGTEHNYVYVG
jgi:hypothetical protein